MEPPDLAGERKDTPGRLRDRASSGRAGELHLAVEIELVRVRSELDLFRAGALEVEPRIDHVLREDVTAIEELLVGLEGVERLLERARRAVDAGPLLGAHLVDVAVDRRRRLD